MSYSHYRDSIAGLGIAVEDAEVLADCMVTKKVCSWINTAPVSNEQITKVNEFFVQNSVPIFLHVDHIPTRDKYIWEVKVKR